MLSILFTMLDGSPALLLQAHTTRPVVLVVQGTQEQAYGNRRQEQRCVRQCESPHDDQPRPNRRAQPVVGGIKRTWQVLC